MEDKKIFTCHLEAESGQYPEYCVQNVCCGVYKQQNVLGSFVCLLLLSLLIISLTCCLIYVWIKYEEETRNNSQPVHQTTRTENRNVAKRGNGKEAKSTSKKAGKKNKSEEQEVGEESEEEEEEEGEDNDNEDENVKAMNKIPKGKNTVNEANHKKVGQRKKNEEEDTEDEDGENKAIKNKPQSRDSENVSSNSKKSRKTSPGGQKEQTEKGNQNNNDKHPSNNLSNGNIKITLMREEYISPAEHGKVNNKAGEVDTSDSLEYFNLNYKELDIKKKKYDDSPTI